LLVTVSLLVGAPVGPAVVRAAPDGNREYVVEPGDYLFGIARRHDVSLGALLQANDLAVNDVIHPGQRLAVPVAAAAPGGPAGGGAYTVRSGDSLFGIARRLGVPVRSLLAANGLVLTSVIHPGQRLAIPVAEAAPGTSAAGGAYTVRSGDSMFGIARRLGVPVRSLLAANGLVLTSVIHPGQRLAVPAPAGTAPSVTSPPAAAPRPVTSPPAATSPTRPSAAVVARIVREVWPDALEQTALEIVWRESRLQSDAESECCSGLFQIYFEVHKGWLAGLGIDSRVDLHDPRVNAEAALALYQRAGGWGPWSLAGD
jgi:LysM repeat protein